MASEASITFHSEQWTAEVARLLLEVDEGWVGFRGDAAWSWRDETFSVFSAICDERRWPRNSQAACVAMLQALRTGAISMQLSRTTRSSDGFAQWSLLEMRELGALMKQVVDGESLRQRWEALLAVFVDNMKAKDATYDLEDRTTEDFAARAAKYVPEPPLKLIKLNERSVAETRRTRRDSRPVTRGRAAEEAKSGLDSDDKPLVPRRSTRANATARKRGRRGRSEESEEDDAYHDPTSDDEEVEYWEDDSALRRPRPDEEVRVTQEPTSQGELLAAAEEQQLKAVGQGRPSLPGNLADEEKRRESMSASRPSSAASTKRVSPRQDAPAKKRTVPRRDAPVSPCHDEAVQPNETRRPSRKHQRVQQPTVDGKNTNASNAQDEAPQVFLNPYGREGKPWGEFVVEVLLAERTARNEDELDYVQFVRGLYEI